MLKYITKPVTSTSVATKGADDVAGSSFSLFSIMGIIEPVSVPHKTMPITDSDTVSPTSIQLK